MNEFIAEVSELAVPCAGRVRDGRGRSRGMVR
jgi:hypothetical protein